MANLKIEEFKDGKLASKVTIRGWIIKVAARLIPQKARDDMQAEGIDLAELQKILDNPEEEGIIMEIEKYDEEVHKRTVISIERTANEQGPAKVIAIEPTRNQ